jgi:hypothetical protein
MGAIIAAFRCILQTRNKQFILGVMAGLVTRQARLLLKTQFEMRGEVDRWADFQYGIG